MPQHSLLFTFRGGTFKDFRTMPVLEEQNTFVSEFEQAERSLSTVGPASVHRLRQAAIQRFSALGFPTLEDEEWRFTPLAPLMHTKFRLGTAVPLDAAVVGHLVLASNIGHRLVFANGQYASSQSSAEGLPQGVVVTDLADALKNHRDKIEPHLAQHAEYEDHAFTALNTAFLQDGAFLYLPKNVVLEKPIFLMFVSAAVNEATVSYPRTLIVAEHNSQARIVEAFAGPAGYVYFTNAVTEIITAEGANVEYSKLQQESQRAFHVHTLQMQMAKSSNVKSHTINLGGRLVRNEVNAVLDGEGCECTLNGLSVAAGEQLVDNHTRIDHAKARCASHELYKSILDGKAHGVFNGKIYVHPDAQKTDAKQTNQTLLLSENAVINAMPQLEIFADDVKCTHGATVGQLDAESIFYLRTRGIDREEARALLTYAFANDIVRRISVDSLRDGLESLLIAIDKHR
jgi:Fe-S cluster assembly protein SufD